LQKFAAGLDNVFLHFYAKKLRYQKLGKIAQTVTELKSAKAFYASKLNLKVKDQTTFETLKFLQETII
jgi:hypothetical protein